MLTIVKSKDKLSKRTIRRHTKAQRDMKKARMKKVAQRLRAEDYTYDEIAEALSDKFCEKVTFGQVRTLLKK